MILDYIKTAMKHAKFEVLSDDGTYYGEIPPCNGVYANATTKIKCEKELEEVLEEWILFRVHQNLSIPSIDGIDLDPPVCI